jgi:nucleoside-diphosphate-sugar epimerase
VSRVLVVGAGDTGLRAALDLVHRHHEVTVLRRSAALVPEPLRRVHADVTDRTALDQVTLPDAEVLVYCVAAGRAADATYRTLYVEGLTNVLASLSARGVVVRRVVFASSTAVYGQCHGELVDEDGRAEPVRYNGRRMLEAEAVAASFGVAEPLAARLGGIYGPGRTRLVERVRAGLEPVGEAMRDPHTNRIHVEDAARALAFLATCAAPPRVVNVVDDHPARRSEVVRWLAARMAVDVPAAVEEGPKAAGPPERSDDKRVANARLRALGFDLTYPTYREGYAALLDG